VNDEVIKGDKQLNYLLVEGSDDSQVFTHLFRYYRLDNHISIEDKKGIDALIASLRVELRRRAETRLGIVVDADTDIATRWQALRHKLLEAEFMSVPLQPDPLGTVLRQEGRPVVGIWLMPNNVLPGMLEDYMSLLIPTSDALWPIAEDIVQQVIVKERRFPLTQEMKARIHTWLAWQDEPGKPMGLAITKRYLNPASPYAQQLIEWMRKLFDIQEAN